MNIEKNLQSLVQQIEPLQYVLNKLEKANIRYGLFAGAHVAVLAGTHIPTDIDFIVHDEDMLRLRQAFPFAHTEDRGNAVFMYIGKGNVIEFMSGKDILREQKRYPFRLTDLAVEHVTSYAVSGNTINLVDPADTVLFKAILQRAPHKDRSDLGDIKAILAFGNLDKEYLAKRLDETNARERTENIWQEFSVF